MRSPLGDQAGFASFSPHRVSRRGARDPVGSSQRLVAPLFSCIEYAVTAQAAADPSGARATPATRSSFQRVSMSRGEGAGMGKARPGGGLYTAARARPEG